MCANFYPKYDTSLLKGEQLQKLSNINALSMKKDPGHILF